MTVAAAIYADYSKIPEDGSRFILLVCVSFVFINLVSSIIALIKLSNLLVASGSGRSITTYAGVSFFSLVASGFFILVFFFWRTFISQYTPGPAQMSDLSNAKSIAMQQIGKAETMDLKDFKIDNDKYILRFAISPGVANLEVKYDPKLHLVIELHRQ